MTDPKDPPQPSRPTAPSTEATDDDTRDKGGVPGKADRPKEIGGRAGPDPARYGDWEIAGRCIDF